MKKAFLIYVVAQLIGLWAVSCAKQSGGELKIVQGYWGHLSDINNTLPSYMFLSHLEKNNVYKVCLAKEMNEKYPGIQEEIKAAINIWAYYIGREIPVEINLADLPEADENDSEEQTMDAYYAACPKGIHLVMAESYFMDSAVGKTLSSYSSYAKDGSRKVTEFKRALFLRKSTQASEDGTDQSEQKVAWTSLEQALKKSLKSTEILEIMKKRDQKIYMTKPDELLTFKTIVHEFGHIWGLCDQYALAENSTNCDGRYASLNAAGHIMLHDEATMSTSKWIAALYLADDDIQGIQKLAARKEFFHGWPSPKEYELIAKTPITTTSNIALALVRKAKRTGNNVEINMAIATLTSSRIKVRIFELNYSSWLEFGDSILPGSVSYKNYNLSLNLGRPYNLSKVEVTFQAIENGPDGEKPLGDPIIIEREIQK